MMTYDPDQIQLFSPTLLSKVNIIQVSKKDCALMYSELQVMIIKMKILKVFMYWNRLVSLTADTDANNQILLLL